MSAILQRIPQATREGVFFFLTYLAIACATIASLVFAYHTSNTSAFRMQEARAQSLAAMIDARELEGLTLSETDITSSSYTTLKEKLMRTRAANEDLRFVYLMAKRGDHVYFMVDSENPSSSDYSPPGQEYTEASRLLLSGWDPGVRVISESYADRWGDWISALAPIVNDAGDTVALLGVDTSAAAHRILLFTEMALILSTAIFLTLLVVLLQIARRRERDLIGLKTDFLALASHELRSPLSKIRWELASFLSLPGLDDAAHKSVQTLYTHVIGLIRKTGGLLQTVSVEHGLSRPETLLPTDLSAIVRRSVEHALDGATERGINITLDDAFDGYLDISADEERLGLVFDNILANAVKYSPDGSAVSITYSASNDRHQVDIIDHGLGIPSAEQRAIFGGFYRASNIVHSGVLGSGFGLYIAKKIVEQHGGMIHLHSTQGTGTTVTILLPIHHST